MLYVVQRWAHPPLQSERIFCWKLRLVQIHLHARSLAQLSPNLYSIWFKLILNYIEIILESTARGALDMMAENSLTFLPLDDPEPKVVTT